MKKEWLYPIPGSLLADLLSGIKGEYTEAQATASYLLDHQRGRVKSVRSYARIWGWSKSRVDRALPQIKANVGSWRSFYGEVGARLEKNGETVADFGGTPAGHQRDAPGTETSDSSVQSNGSGTVLGHQRDTSGTLTYKTKELRKKKNISIKFSDADVERIYQIYPRKVGKRSALTKIRKALHEVADKEDDPVGWLAARVEAFAQSSAGRQGQFTPHPATWFNQGRYLDDPGEWQRTEQKKEFDGVLRRRRIGH